MEIVFRVILNPITCVFHLFTVLTCVQRLGPTPSVNRCPCVQGAQLLRSHGSGVCSPDVSHLCPGHTLRRDVSASALRGWQYCVCLALLTGTAVEHLKCD